VSSRFNKHSHIRSRFRGFSFTEILFAVVVLGIGFIMVAAIFPVAIQQGKLTTEQGTATGVAREALGYLGQVGANSDSIADSQGGPLFPATGRTAGTSTNAGTITTATSYYPPYLGTVCSFVDPQPNPPSPNQVQTYPFNTGTSNYYLGMPQPPALNPSLWPATMPPTNSAAISPITASPNQLWNRLKLSLIVPSDQRYAFVGLYKRDGNPFDRRTWSPFAQVWFIPVTPRSRSIYSAGQLATPGTDVTGPNLQARLVKVSIDADPSQAYAAGSSVHYILYNWTSGPAVPAGYQPNSLSENCYVIIANDAIISPVEATTINGLSYNLNVDLGRMNGRIYHVGLRRPDLDSTTPSAVTAYDLAADGDFSTDAGADGFYGVNSTTHVNDDIFTIGMTLSGPGNAPVQPISLGGSGFNGTSPVGNASGPADAFVVGLDNTPSADPGTSQEISAFTTFIKVN
jgi:type II secretory pathway pseudopilin PulG